MTVPIRTEQISIYAELLSNIRQVSITATLPSPSNQNTSARILDSGRLIRLSHNACSETLELPGIVLASSELQIPQRSRCDLTWRLPLCSADEQSPRFCPEDQVIPWAATDITQESSIRCRTCSSAVIPRGAIKYWKDLPSENWAEMMDVWHCHKPHDHAKHQDESPANKAYGANNAITAQQDVGFSDIATFMFHEDNCRNLMVSACSAFAA